MRAVDLIEDDDRPEADFERLREDESGLGHWTLLGVDEEKNGVDHAEYPFDLAGKVGVAGGVDNIDFIIFEENAGMFRENGDPALFFLVIAVHDPFRDLFVVPKNVRLAQEAVQHGGFTVVDVGDDGNIADFFGLKHKISVFQDYFAMDILMETKIKHYFLLLEK